MSKHILYGVCPESVDLTVENGIIKNVCFHGGCPGNLTAISKLIEGQRTDDVIEKLTGITCGYKNTSCADQLARVLKTLK